jgi:Fe-S cluster biogenesis protein NfuA
MAAQPEFQQRLQSIERLLGEVDAAADPSLRSTVKELVQLVMDLHGAGLERMLELTRAAGGGGAGLMEKFSGDDLVASLLVLYGLHPLSLEARVNQALEKARARLRPHQGEIELLSVQDGAVRLMLRANGHGCGSNAEALKEIVENAVYQAAPDVVALIVEGAGDKQGFVPLEMLQGIAPAPHTSKVHLVAAGEKGAL